MTDHHHLTDLLERAADRVPVGPAPVSAMVGVAGRSAAAPCGRGCRRRCDRGRGHRGDVRGAVVPGAAAADERSGTGSGGAARRDAVRRHRARGDRRTRGVGDQRDPLQRRRSRTLWSSTSRCSMRCAAGRPNGVDSVEVTTGSRRFDFAADRQMTIDGVSADRQATTCETWQAKEVCNGTVYIPSLNVSFRAASSTGAGEVDRILEQVRIVPRRGRRAGLRVREPVTAGDGGCRRTSGRCRWPG